MGLVIYALVRLAIYWELRSLPRENPRWVSTGPGADGIDTSKLSGRVEQLRQEGHTGETERSASFKKPLLVEEKRREIAKHAYFQKPVPVPEPTEPPEHEDGWRLMFI